MKSAFCLPCRACLTYRGKKREKNKEKNKEKKERKGKERKTGYEATITAIRRGFTCRRRRSVVSCRVSCRHGVVSCCTAGAPSCDGVSCAFEANRRKESKKIEGKGGSPGLLWRALGGGHTPAQVLTRPHVRTFARLSPSA